MREYKGIDLTFDLLGKVAIVTGGGSGIGRETAKLLAERNARVVIFDVQDDIETVAGNIGAGIRGVKVDVVNVAEAQGAVDAVAQEYGGIDILHNIAGLGHGEFAENVTEQDWDRLMAVNLKGLFFMAQAVGRHMISSNRGGKIINMASQAGVVGLEKHVLYGATKAAVINITKTLANEWGKHAINVNAIAPTVVLTPMAAAYWKGEVAEEFLKTVPIGRFAQPEEIAAMALYLSAPVSDMLSGETIVIDGGFTIR